MGGGGPVNVTPAPEPGPRLPGAERKLDPGSPACAGAGKSGVTTKLGG